MIVYKEFGNQNLTKKQRLINHALAFLLPSLMFIMFEVTAWFLGAVYAIHLENINYDHFFTPFINGLDNAIPVWTWLFPFYISALPVWVIGCYLMMFVKGRRDFYEMLSISGIVFFLSLILYLIFPCNSRELAKMGCDMIGDKDDFFSRMVLRLLGNGETGTGFAAFHSNFPSMHASCTILMCYGLWTGFYKNVIKGKKMWSWWEWIINTTFIFYAVMICISTFSLKQHYFVDWIMSFFLCTVIWIGYKVILFYISRNYQTKNAKDYVPGLMRLFESINVAFGLNAISLYSYRWSNQINSYYSKKCNTKNKKLWHDILVIITILIIYIVLLGIASGFGATYPTWLYTN